MNLTLTGEPGMVLHAGADLAQTLRRWTVDRAVVGIVQSRGVALVGLTIDGDRQGGAYSGGEDGALRGYSMWLEWADRGLHNSKIPWRHTGLI
jgi:hypothetical protein